MPHPCVVCGRSRMNPNNREEDYMFFGFPVNHEDRCRKWLEFCSREDLYKLTKKQLLQRMVCSKHFGRKDFLNEYQDRLNCTGVPSIYDPTQSLYNITCVLCGKSRTDPSDDDYDGTTFHHFPGEEFRCLKWLDFVGVDSYYRLTRKEILYCYICSNHFDETQFMPGFKSRLSDNAVPSIRNPDQKVTLPEISMTVVKTSYNTKLSQSNEKIRKYEPLTSAVLESQACAACGRSRSDPRNKIEKYKFHPFPAYEIGRCLRWCQFLGREDLLKMSPNQIRKLVLCSKHFLSGASFHKVGPCDAVPTIKEIDDTTMIEDKVTLQYDEIEEYENDDEERDIEVKVEEVIAKKRPLISSKKPKINNKPAPLAKKRGRAKRSTSICIPKIVDNLNIENSIRKIPIPAANWKIQFANNQFQPLTLANTNSPSTAITTDGKKVILPFTGNISSLGAPIPVHSLSSMPPGFLIKINLPEQQEQIKPLVATKTRGKQTRRRKKATNNKTANVVATNEKKVVKRRRTKKNIEKIEDIGKIDDTLAVKDHTMKEEPQQISFKREILPKPEQIVTNVPDVIEVLDDEFIDIEDYEINEEDDQIHVYQEIQTNNDTETEEEVLPKEKKLTKRERTKRPTMTVRTRRTLMPIRTEVRNFLHKLKPHMSRLPRKAKAQLKLSIVNLVIDRL